LTQNDTKTAGVALRLCTMHNVDIPIRSHSHWRPVAVVGLSCAFNAADTTHRPRPHLNDVAFQVSKETYIMSHNPLTDDVGNQCH